MRLESSLIWPKRLHWEKYLRPQNISEALQILESFKAGKAPGRGHRSYSSDQKSRNRTKGAGRHYPYPGLVKLKLEDGVIKIGALVTHTQVVQSPLLREKALALSEGASQLGSPQIRNLGTVAAIL